MTNEETTQMMEYLRRAYMAGEYHSDLAWKKAVATVTQARISNQIIDEKLEREGLLLKEKRND